jgi:aspartate kinase
MEQPIVSAVTHSADEVVFTLSGIPDEPGSAATVLEAVADEHVNVDTILQNVVHGVAELSFSVPKEDAQATRRGIDAAAETLGPMEIDENEGLGKVSLIGAGMRSHPGIAAKMFRTLASEGINLQMISTSPIKISCMIDRADVERAVRSLHAVFALENEALSVGSE